MTFPRIGFGHATDAAVNSSQLTNRFSAQTDILHSKQTIEIDTMAVPRRKPGSVAMLCCVAVIIINYLSSLGFLV